MKDGSYPVRLVLRDTNGQVYREQKSFVIASTPPTVKVRLERTRYRAGETIPLKVSASESTRTLTARVEGLAPVSLHWDREQGVSTGQIGCHRHCPQASMCWRLRRKTWRTIWAARRCELKWFLDCDQCDLAELSSGI